jgi:DNA repair exonuclease SbcCD ATPase subunit
MIKRISSLGILTLAALCFTGTAFAADSAQQDGVQPNGDQQKLMQKYSQDAQKLKDIHDKTVKKNPQLVKEQQQFRDQVRDAIKKQGYDVETGQKRMQSLAKKMQSDDLDQDQRKQVMQKFQKERQQLSQARNAALSKPEIKKSGEKLQNDTITAMNKQNSKTKKLISEMKNMRNKLQQSAKAQESNNNGQ